MKTKSFFISLILFFAIAVFSANSQSKSFNGDWKLNLEKTTLSDGNLFLSKITFKLRNDSLLTARTYQNANGEEYPFSENLALTGKDSKITIYDMPRTSKATRGADGLVLIESVTTFYANGGEDSLTTKETWSIDAEGLTLTMVYTNKMSAGEASGTSYFNKTK